jgi:large subunit ribosomal protein L21
MYAVIETGGKQYRVELGSELAIERLDGAPGETINFDRVLLVADGDAASVGTPLVSDALVTGEVVRQDRGEKIVVFKYRPKARHRSKQGHRQEQTVIRVADIRFNGRSAADEAGVQEKEQSKARKAAAADAERKAAADKALADKLAATEAADAKAADAKATDAKATDATDAKASGDKSAAEKPASKATTTAASKSAAKPKTTSDDEKATTANAAETKSAVKPPKAPTTRKTTTPKPEAEDKD